MQPAVLIALSIGSYLSAGVLQTLKLHGALSGVIVPGLNLTLKEVDLGPCWPLASPLEIKEKRA